MRFSLRLLFFSLVCGLLSTSTASAACDYYIAPGGSDNGSGTMAAPWKTIKYASSKLSSGQTLCARGGTYFGQAGSIWKSSGTASAPVTFRNYPGEVPVFDGQWGDTGTEGDFLVFSNNSNVVVDGITMQHFVDQYGNGTIDIHNGVGPVNNIVIQNCTFIDNGSHTAQDHHIYLAAGATNITIRDNLFIRAAGSSIQANHTPAASGIRIYNNVMIGGALKCSASKSNPCSATARQSWGIMISDAKDTQIYNNTIYGMQRSGIEFNYGTTGSGPYIVKNNLLVNNTSAGIRVTALYAPAYASDYNGFSGNGADINWKGSNLSRAQFASSTPNDRHSISGDPSFVSAGSNFHLNSNSPVINKGATLSLLNTDKDGVPRVSGSYDIGAYEYQSSEVPPRDPASEPTPTAAFSPTALNFASQNIGTLSAVKTMTLKNTGTVALSLAAAPAASGDFASSGTCAAGVSYAPGATCTANVVFKPTASGTRSGALSIRVNGAASTISIPLSGSGVVPPPAVTLSATSLTFSSQTVGTKSAIKTVTIKNTGTNAIVIPSGFVLKGDFAFGGTGTCSVGTTYAPGASCTASVVFKPKAVGPRMGSLSIQTSASSTPLVVKLSGTGK